jgi:hypothetical protein
MNNNSLNSLDTFERFLQEVRQDNDKVGAILSNKTRTDENLDIECGERRNTFHSRRNYNVPRSIKTKTYFPEDGLSRGLELTRKRLASRFATMDFPFDSCMEALKQKGTKKLKEVAETLLQWFPKGSGGRNMVFSLVKVIENSEKKLTKVFNAIKNTMTDGTPDERLKAVTKYFKECDDGSTKLVEIYKLK